MVTSTRKKYVFMYSLIITVIFLLVLNYKNVNQSILYVTKEPQNTTREPETKYILYWTKMFSAEDFNLGFGSEIFAKCTYKNCYTTNNKTLVPLEKFSAIIFHGVEYFPKLQKKPSNRTQNQVYIYSNQESPLNTPALIQETDNFYNWTMTYRLDSDLIRAYGYVVKQDTNYSAPTLEEVKKKEFRIAWFVSNCAVRSRRDDLALKLNKYIPVDVYGSCGKLKCPRKNQEDCYRMLEKKYKFYFSAENSLCSDYVTEKLYNILKLDVVPVVYGLADYSQIAPPNSYVDVTKFTSVLDLAIYLQHLDSHPEEYLEYFEWKKNFIIDTSSQTMLCDMCEKLNRPIQPKVYTNINAWWSGKYADNLMSVCKASNDLPEIVKSEI